MSAVKDWAAAAVMAWAILLANYFTGNVTTLMEFAWAMSVLTVVGLIAVGIWRLVRRWLA